MTMKTAQDISPSAIVCLSLAMLVGNMYMGPTSEYMGGQTAEYLGEQPSVEVKTTLVDISQGRRLERLPDYLGTSTGAVASAYSQDAHSEAIKIAQEKEVDVKEVANLWELSLSKEPLSISDASTVLIILCCTILGIAAACTDVLEMAEEAAVIAEGLDDSSTVNEKAKEAAPLIITNDSKKLQRTNFVTNFIGVAGVLASVLLSYSANFYFSVAVESRTEDASTQELRELASDHFHNPALASDTIMFLVGAFALLAVVIMRVDILEMAEQLRDASSPEVPGAEPAKMSPEDNSLRVVANSMEVVPQTTTKDTSQLDTFHLLMQTIICICAAAVPALALLVPSASFDTAAGQASSPLHASAQELNNLAASSMQQDLTVAPDSFVMLVLGAFVLLAVIVMKTDVDEMAKEATSEEGLQCEVLEDEAAHAEEEREVTPTMFNDTDQLRSAKVVFCISAVAWAVSMLLLYLTSTDDCEMPSPSFENEITQELRVSLVSVHQLPSIAPDSLVILGLGFFSMLAMVVMKTDISEIASSLHKTQIHVGKPMAEQVHDAASSEGQGAEPLKISAGEKTVAVAMSTMKEVVQIKVEGDSQLHTFHLFITSIVCICAVALSALGLLVSSASFDTAIGQATTPLHASAQELNNLAVGSMQQDLSIVPDRSVMLVLGVFVLLAMNVMRIDILEMAEQLRIASSPEVQGAEPVKMSSEDNKSAAVANSIEEVTQTIAEDGSQLHTK